MDDELEVLKSEYEKLKEKGEKRDKFFKVTLAYLNNLRRMLKEYRLNDE